MDIDDYNVHFLDSNIIICLILEWEPCCDYLDNHPSTKNTSKFVYNECTTVFLRLKRIQKHFLSEIINFSETNPINDINDVKLFAKTHIESYWRESGLFKDKFESVLYNFIAECSPMILASINSIIEYMKFIGEIDDSFKDAKNQLNFICYSEPKIELHSHCPGIHDRNLENTLESFGIHKSDRTILLDCNYLRTNDFTEDVAYITSDKGIIDAAPNIQTTLGGIFVCKLSYPYT